MPNTHDPPPVSPRSMPSAVTPDVPWFDRFATKIERFTSRAWFFVLCVFLVIVWGPTYFLFSNIGTWQLLINTTTTIITFLLVALIQNTQTRSNQAIHRKLNAMAEAQADHMSAQAEHFESHSTQADVARAEKLWKDIGELRLAVGLEDRESTN